MHALHVEFVRHQAENVVLADLEDIQTGRCFDKSLNAAVRVEDGPDVPILARVPVFLHPEMPQRIRLQCLEGD